VSIVPFVLVLRTVVLLAYCKSRPRSNLVQIATDHQCLTIFFCNCKIPLQYGMTSQNPDAVSQKFCKMGFCPPQQTLHWKPLTLTLSRPRTKLQTGGDNLRVAKKLVSSGRKQKYQFYNRQEWRRRMA